MRCGLAIIAVSGLAVHGEEESRALQRSDSLVNASEFVGESIRVSTPSSRYSPELQGNAVAEPFPLELIHVAAALDR